MISPEGAKVLVRNGVEVFVERGAGELCRFDDIQYEQAGAVVVPTIEKLLQKTDLLVKVQPPTPVEYELLNKRHIILSFINYIQHGERIQALVDTHATYFAAELIQDADGKYPMLMGMSEIAGRMCIYIGANLLSITQGGKGKLISGAAIVKPATITIVGGGIAGRTAAIHAAANGAHVNLLCMKDSQMEEPNLDHPNLHKFMYSEVKAREVLPHTDILVVAVFALKRKRSEVFITKEMVKLMEPGSVLIDLSIEQATVVESSHLTSLDKPTFVVDDIVHYCVPNIAATVPVTASRILTKKILPYLKILSLKGIKDSIDKEPGLLSSVFIYKGKVTNRLAADFHGHEFYNIFELLELNL
jgi:alanine dehydrogenase